jgi:hypothetical protein
VVKDLLWVLSEGSKDQGSKVSDSFGYLQGSLQGLFVEGQVRRFRAGVLYRLRR